MLCRLYLNRDLHPANSIELPQDQAHYLRSVMRLGLGDPVVLFNGSGGEYHGTVEALSKHGTTIFIESFTDVSREMPVGVHIIQAACRSEKIDTILQKGTELGAASFHIVKSERSALKLHSSKLEKRILRWQKIVIEAAEQSYRTIIPPVQWHDKIDTAPAQGRCYTLHPDSATIWSDEKNTLLTANAITLAIGPEGGWSKRDLQSLNNQGFTNLSFGPRVMRTETAAPALLAAIQSLLD